ncbi:hypothetical protein B0T16DRAFT_393929 [Cercophora newfieldiana]|uniref:Ubiquitin-like protease family profile domain-containing protein n=1 Tax=Cercophora newfieldiana TaxID=92897 RepID=A0AA39XZ59_9PEZI|nr:hypothetical protein B0T16DRAFT_393929 [Cercophora newfieldiana]
MRLAAISDPDDIYLPPGQRTTPQPSVPPTQAEINAELHCLLSLAFPLDAGVKYCFSRNKHISVEVMYAAMKLITLHSNGRFTTLSPATTPDAQWQEPEVFFVDHVRFLQDLGLETKIYWPMRVGSPRHWILAVIDSSSAGIRLVDIIDAIDSPMKYIHQVDAQFQRLRLPKSDTPNPAIFLHRCEPNFPLEDSGVYVLAWAADMVSIGPGDCEFHWYNTFLWRKVLKSLLCPDATDWVVQEGDLAADSRRSRLANSNGVVAVMGWLSHKAMGAVKEYAGVSENAHKQNIQKEYAAVSESVHKKSIQMRQWFAQGEALGCTNYSLKVVFN